LVQDSGTETIAHVRSIVKAVATEKRNGVCHLLREAHSVAGSVVRLRVGHARLKR